MASFVDSSKNLLEINIKSFEVDVPLHPEIKIGEGSAAIVYQHKIKGKIVAVKQMRQHMSKYKVLQVANKLKELNHQNVINFMGYCCRPSCFVFEYCFIELQHDVVNNLAQLVNIFNEQQHFVFVERLDYIVQATKGLLYLHDKGVVHRDFKPANMLVTGTLKQTVVKISDFDDLMELKQTMMTTTKVNFLKGMTVAYTAPELCNGEMKKPSEMTDVYSWGISAFEILNHLSSAWSNVLPVLNDSLLLAAIKDNKRPDITELATLYGSKDQDVNVALHLISQSWNIKQDQRPVLQEVSAIQLLSLRYLATISCRLIDYNF